MKLTVVTLVTRPGNLPAIADSINAGLLDAFGGRLRSIDLDVRWLVLFDQAKVGAAAVELPAQAPDQTEGYYVEVEPDWCGEPFLRNKALDLVEDGHVAWVDDDNLVEPDFFTAVARELAEQPDAVVVFDQVLADGTPRCFAGPDNVRFGSIDTAQLVAPRDVYGTYRFDNVANGTDGFMYERLWQRHGTRFRFVNEPRVLYNALHR